MKQMLDQKETTAICPIAYSEHCTIDISPKAVAIELLNLNPNPVTPIMQIQVKSYILEV